MLSSQEEQIWGDVLRFWAEEAEEPILPPAHHGAVPARDDEEHLPVAVVVAARIALLLVLVGLVPLGLAIALATALGWAVWRHGSRATAPSAGR